MNVLILEAITVTKVPPVMTLLEVTHVPVCWATQEVELLVMVCAHKSDIDVYYYYYYQIISGAQNVANKA